MVNYKLQKDDTCTTYEIFILAEDPCLTFLYRWIGYLLTMYYPLKLFQK